MCSPGVTRARTSGDPTLTATRWPALHHIGCTETSLWFLQGTTPLPLLHLWSSACKLHASLRWCSRAVSQTGTSLLELRCCIVKAGLHTRESCMALLASSRLRHQRQSVFPPLVCSVQMVCCRGRRRARAARCAAFFLALGDAAAAGAGDGRPVLSHSNPHWQLCVHSSVHCTHAVVAASGSSAALVHRRLCQLSVEQTLARHHCTDGMPGWHMCPQAQCPQAQRMQTRCVQAQCLQVCRGERRGRRGRGGQRGARSPDAMQLRPPRTAS